LTPNRGRGRRGTTTSPCAKAGYISHTYTDHGSLLKFIERNWRLPSLSQWSLDRLPNPTTRGNNPYVPVNRPAIGDMFDYFDFSGSHASGKRRRSAIMAADTVAPHSPTRGRL
jgi:hypothetical protein